MQGRRLKTSTNFYQNWSQTRVCQCQVSFIAWSIFALSTSLFASEQSTQSSAAVSVAEAPSTAAVRSTHEWGVYGGVAAGYGAVFDKTFSGPAHGNQYLISGGISYQMSRWVFDGGIGWLYSKLAGTKLGQDSLQMRTRAGLIELSPRLRLSQRWQLGPVVNFAFGADTSFAPKIGNAALSTFAGLKAVYQLPVGPAGAFDLRLWQQISTDVSINSRQSLFTVIGVQVDIPVSWNKKHYEASRNELNSGILVSGIDKSVPKNSHEVHINLDPQKVFFGTNSSQVKPEVGLILRSVGEYLALNSESWERLDVDGHADQRGSFHHNLILSRQRSHSVVEAMTLSTPATVMKVNQKGYSFSRPLDPHQNPKAWSKNRRVELVFTGVKDPAALVQRLTALKPLL